MTERVDPRITASLSAVLACVALAAPHAVRAQEALDVDLKAVRDAWAIASYRTPRDQRLAAFEALRPRAAALSAKYPKRAEALIWDGIVLSSYAGVRGGLGALAPAEQAKARFEAALALDENALGGAAHTSLGALYHRVPGFPIGFGSDAKARMHLERALQINPDAIDPNYFYGELLFEQGEYARALEHLERALRAPPRPGREVADEGRRGQIRVLIAKTRQELI
jgi:tetratricopeptide (TPR) repeat protein